MTHREQPVANRLCAATWVARDVNRHRERLGLNNVKNYSKDGNSKIIPFDDHLPAEPIHSVVDARPPRTLSLRVDRAAKRAQTADEYGLEIDRQNALLLQRMSSIVINGQGAAHAKMMGLDSATTPRKGPRSLNAGARERELARIGADNAAILRRLTERKPVYDRNEWQQHGTKHASYLNNMRERPLPVDAASPAARNLVPLPKFLREQIVSGTQTERRPRHAYLHGNYSATFSRTGTQNIQQPYSHNQYGDGYHSGSQTTRSVTAPMYQLHTPQTQKTGVSKQHTQSGMLQPLTSRPQPNLHSPSSDSQPLSSPIYVRAAIDQGHASSNDINGGGPFDPSRHTLIVQCERSFVTSNGQTQSLMISVYELGALAATNAAATLSSSRPVSSSVHKNSSGPDMLYSAPIQEGLHSLLFYAPTIPGQIESRHIQIPWASIRSLGEVQSAGDIALSPSSRISLALVLMDRLTIGLIERGSPLLFHTGKLNPDKEEHAAHKLRTTQQQHSQQIHRPQSSKSNGSNGTNTVGNEYYFDEKTQQYVPHSTYNTNNQTSIPITAKHV
jgi:hypothetical protein